MDAKNVSAAKPKIGGSVFVAPLGTKLPEDAKSELDAKFNSLGYCSDDGVSNNNSPETDTQKAWGGAVVLNLFSGKEDTFKLKLIESLNVNVLKTVYGSSNVTGDLDTGLTIKAKNEEPEQFSWVIDMILKGKILKRLVIPCGFHYSVDDAVGDDWELIEILSEMNNDEYLSVVPFAKKLLGNAQYERLKKFCRDKKTGRVLTSKMQENIMDIFNSNKTVKN